MKKILIITYDLSAPHQNYKGVLKEIKLYGTWARISESSYLIKTDRTPEKVRGRLLKYIDEDDKLFVGVLNAPAAWYGLTDSISDWILKHLD